MTSRLFINVVLCLIALCSLDCSTTQPVRVLPEGEIDAQFSLGGPVVLPANGLSAPVPYFTAGLMYGSDSDMTLIGNLHVTALMYKTLGVDAGAAWRLVPQQGSIPEVTLKATAMGFVSLRDNETRLYPMITMNASYLVLPGTLAYIGADNLIQFSSPSYFLSPFLGMQFPIAGKWRGEAEVRWVAANQPTSHGVFEGLNAPGGNGAIGVYLGAQLLLKKGTP